MSELTECMLKCISEYLCVCWCCLLKCAGYFAGVGLTEERQEEFVEYEINNKWMRGDATSRTEWKEKKEGEERKTSEKCHFRVTVWSTHGYTATWNVNTGPQWQVGLPCDTIYISACLLSGNLPQLSQHSCSFIIQPFTHSDNFCFANRPAGLKPTQPPGQHW